MIEIIECVCSIASLVISLVSLFLIKSINNSVNNKVKAKDVSGGITINN